MQEILTVITYLVVWLICKEILGIQSGLITLIISLGAAVCVYILSSVRGRRDKTDITGNNGHNGD
jgi:hypothetical protein